MRFSNSDKVRSKKHGFVGIIEEIGTYHAGVQYYRVFWGGTQGSATVSEYDIEPFCALPKPSESLTNNLGGYQDFQRLITQQRLSRDNPLRNNIYAFNASRTRFYPYQFKPLVKFLDSPEHRLLICDEVGLGKTIEAGLILTELRARQTVRRVLVVCPASLTGKWRLELKTRFGEDFRILNARGFIEYLEEYEDDPDRTILNGIVSIESIRQNAVIERLESLAPDFDLLIVDEAHHWRNFGTKQRRSGDLVSRSAGALLMLTATPIHLGNENLFSLLNILSDEEFPNLWTADSRFRENEPIVLAQTCLGQFPPRLHEAAQLLEKARESSWFKKNELLADLVTRLNDLQKGSADQGNYRLSLIQAQRDISDVNLLGHIFTRTRKREVIANFPERRSYAIEVTLSDKEKNFYDAVTNFIRRESELRGHLPLVLQWRLNTPQRRMASCMPAMIEYYRNHLGLEPEDQGDDDSSIEFTDDDRENTSDFNAARQRLQDIIRTWPADRPDSKYDAFLQRLTEIQKNNQHGACKVIIFAFFKETLRYLSRRLEQDGFESATISGDVPPYERGPVIEKFRTDPRVQVLLSSRVGGEGLDFQFCSIVANYDLPWNPMEVEQRIGRLDRLGQESPLIHIYNLWIEDTIESRILRTLYERINIFERSIGGLETILGDITSALERDIFSKSLSKEEENRKLEQTWTALDKKLQDLEGLESQAARFVGADQYFDQEVRAIRDRRRYVTGEQLRRYLLDFLRRHASRTRLEYDHAAKRGRLFPDEELRKFIQKSGRAGDMTRLLLSDTRGLEITFDSETAFADQRIQFLNVLHPLIGAISDYYQQAGIHTSNAQHVLLETDNLRSGFYYYFVYRLRVTGARALNTLECVFLDEDLAEPLESNKAEALFGEMAECGKDSEGPGLEIDPEIADKAWETALHIFLDRLQVVREDSKRANDRFIESRLTSLETFYEKSIRQKQEQLVRATETRKEERYIRMLEGTLRRLTSELEAKRQELDSHGDIEVSHDEIAAGILEVV